jgi:hypothetical protein
MGPINLFSQRVQACSYKCVEWFIHIYFVCFPPATSVKYLKKYVKLHQNGLHKLTSEAAAHRCAVLRHKDPGGTYAYVRWADVYPATVSSVDIDAHHRDKGFVVIMVRKHSSGLCFRM